MMSAAMVANVTMLFIIFSIAPLRGLTGLARNESGKECFIAIKVVLSLFPLFPWCGVRCKAWREMTVSAIAEQTTAV